MFWPCETRTSTCRNFATISSGLYRFLAITVLLDVKDIPQVGPLQWGRISEVPTEKFAAKLVPRFPGLPSQARRQREWRDFRGQARTNTPRDKGAAAPRDAIMR